MCDKKFSIPKEFIKNNKRVYKLAETADFIIEVVDARIAHSGANLLNYAKLNDVKRIILFSNTQKADVEQTKKWMEYYHSQEIYCQMLLCHEEQTSKEYKRCLANFKKLLKKYANKKILIISLPDSNKELLLEKIFDNNETFEKGRGIFFTREKIYRYNNVEFIDTVPITGINFSQPDVYWNTQILGLFKIEDNTEIVAIKAFQLLLTKYQKKLETAYSVRIQPKSSVKQIVKEFIKLMTTNLSLPDSETTDNLILCAKFLEDIKKGRKFPQFHWNELKIMLNNFYLKW